MSTKTHLLEILEQNRGKSVSGADIAARLNLSRNAVWKAVRELKKSGYKITAVNNRGYCLDEDNDIISVPGLMPFLAEPEQGERIHIYESLDSTNNMAKEKALLGAPHGTVIIADEQTAGRGRHGRGFFSPPGQGIYLSFVLHPDRMSFDNPTIVTAYAAVSVCAAIEAVTGKIPRIKWVNDIFINDLKICGILSEAVTDLESRLIQWIVVGIGINFSTPNDDYPAELRGVAGSVFADGRPTTTRNRLAAEIINSMVNIRPEDNAKNIFTNYKKRLMMLGEKIWVNSWDQRFPARAVDIDETGGLIVEQENGELMTLTAGEVSVRREAAGNNLRPF